MFIKNTVVLLTSFLVSVTIMAQDERGKNELGINAGAMFYQGDLAPNFVGSYKTARPVVGIYYNRILSPYWSARASLAVSGLEGDESKNDKPAYMQLRRFKFTSPLTEVSLTGVFNIFGTNADASMVQRFSPYVFAGAGVAFVNINRDWSEMDTSMRHSPTMQLGLAKDSVAELPKRLAVIPIGAGVKYALSPRLALALEGTYRVTFTDYLDGFSYAANPEKKDSYYSLTLGAVFNFGGSGTGATGGSRRSGKNKVGCPKVF